MEGRGELRCYPVHDELSPFVQSSKTETRDCSRISSDVISLDVSWDDSSKDNSKKKVSDNIKLTLTLENMFK